MNFKKLEMTGKNVLVTGATSGIGLATARLIASRGGNVILNYLYEDEVDPKAVLAEIEAMGVKALLLKADVMNRAQVDEMVAKAMQNFGRIDGLFNNAGGAVGRAFFLEVTTETWQKALDLNLTSIFHVSQAVLPHMVAQRSGRVVNTSSIAYRIGGYEGSIPYSAAKGAVVTMSKGMAGEFLKHGITVNTLAPGPTRTRFFNNDPKRLAQRAASSPMGRLGEPEETAEAAAFLLSDAASYISGALLEVAGGY